MKIDSKKLKRAIQNQRKTLLFDPLDSRLKDVLVGYDNVLDIINQLERMQARKGGK